MVDASTFRFSFGTPDAAEPLPVSCASQEAAPAVSAPPPAREEFPPLAVPDDWLSEAVALPGGRTLRKAHGAGCLDAARSALPATSAAASDLIPGVYEGGAKLWECALDLCGFLERSRTSPLLAGARVLELGCGHGLPGCVALQRGAVSVCFADFNAEVLTSLTAPAAAAAQPPPPAERVPTRYFSGDWGDLPSLLPQGGFDVILTSDSVYALPSLDKLACLIRHCLEPASGVALVAAKSFYFGVGGGSAAFAAAATARGLDVRTAARFEDGASNVREILWCTAAPPVVPDGSAG